MNDTGSNTRLPGNNMVADADNTDFSDPGYSSTGSAHVSSDHPIAAPSSFKYLDDQLNKMDRDNAESDELDDTSSGGANGPAGAVAKATTKIIKHIVVPGVASVGTISIGYVLLLGRTMYSALAMLLGLGLGGQPLDPATLIDYWERDVSKRSGDRDKNVEGMFR